MTAPGPLRSRWRLAPRLSLLSLLTLTPSLAQASRDQVSGTRGDTLMTEREHVVSLRFERGWATLRVQRSVHNAFERHDEAMMSVFLPDRAVATGLRTLGEQDGKPKWFVAELLDAELAAATYTELTGHGGFYPKDPALLSWRGPEELALQVFPVAPDTTKTVDYTLMMPATYVDGHWRIELSALGTPELPASLTIDPANHLDQLFVDGQVVAAGHQLELSADTVIELAARDPAAVELALAAVDTGDLRELVHYRVTLAERLSKLPERAKLVVILDLSRSRSDEEIEAQRRAALAYLRHFDDPDLAAQVALLGFDREVHALSPGFVAAAKAGELLEHASLAPRNGSAVDLALAEADRLLGTAGRGPRRILLLSDFETAASVSPEQSTSVLRHSKAIAHFAEVDDSGTSLTREDTHPWSKLAASSEGVMWYAGVELQPGTPIDDEELAVFEEWARPLRIDRVAVQCTGAVFEPDLPPMFVDTLAEGEGIDELLLSRRPVSELITVGLLWNQPVTYRTKPDKAEGDRWAAMVFGNWLAYMLSEAEITTLAMRGGAVSPMTSYLAIEPGVRPSTEGLDDWERGQFDGFGNRGLSGFGSGGGGIGMGSSRDPQRWLNDVLAGIWSECGGTGSSATVELETMSMELLEFTLTPQVPNPGLVACATQGIWDLELPLGFENQDRWTVEL